jgi:hypothetical protein
MATTLRIPKKLHVTPLCDIRHQEVANAYSEGLYESLYNLRELVPVSHLVECLQRTISLSTFDSQHQIASRDYVGYHIGAMHGTILIETGSVCQDVATLTALDTKDARRGYRAGRHYVFYEATLQEQCLTDDYLIERFHEIAAECTAWHDADSVWQYAIASILWELSGQVFPLTQEEQAYWEAQERAARAELARQQARRDTAEPLGSVPS